MLFTSPKQLTSLERYASLGVTPRPALNSSLKDSAHGRQITFGVYTRTFSIVLAGLNCKQALAPRGRRSFLSDQDDPSRRVQAAKIFNILRNARVAHTSFSNT